jgi:hypothetical protein
MTRKRPIYADGYFKVSRRLLTSSLWTENSDVLRVFLVLLELAQDPRGPQDGTVIIARPILAGKALLSNACLERCLAVLLSPDAESRSPEFEGRRVEALPNGFRILNHQRYHDEARDRLLRSQREASGRLGGEKSGKVRRINAVARSKSEANAKQNEAHEHEHEHEHETEEKRPSVAIAPPPAWTREACDDWIARYQGTAPGGRIGKALKPLVVKHGWPEVRQSWQSYLSQTEPEFASAERFAATYGRWSGSAPAPKSKAQQSEDRTREVLRRFVEGGETNDAR